jgi:reactive intermediate/imine deaminase
MKQIITTKNAPSAIGTYSQAVKVGNTVYVSGQIPLVPDTMTVVEGDFAEHVRQIFRNLQGVIEAAGGTLQDIVKLGVYLTDMSNFTTVNEVMSEFVQEPYPARAAVGVAALPKGVSVEMDAIVVV